MGRERHRSEAPGSVRLCILTVSDSRTIESDGSGRLIRELCEKAGHSIAEHRVVPDDPDRLRSELAALLGREDTQAVLVNGGTGISGRDRTYEAVSAMLERRIDGFGELFRSLSFAEIGPAAMLSRAVAGTVSGRPVFCMPGSPAAVRLALERLILPEIGHVVAEAGRFT
jgi:molybdenum cofactor biosynthesis protein B